MRSVKPSIFALTSLALLAGLVPAGGLLGAVVRVDSRATGAADGSSWADAYPRLQSALALAGPVEIWIAEGAYLTGTTRTATFQLAGAKKLYGGFAGTETTRAARDPVAHPVVLSGDVNGDDATTGSRTDNAYHVVSCFSASTATILDGLTIQGGAATRSTGLRSQGGGIYAESASFRIVDCRFENNTGHLGAGVIVIGGSPTFDRCRFVNNKVGDGRGAGLFLASGTTGRVSDCLFEANAVSGGSGSNDGGGIFMDFTTTLLVERTIFRGNSSLTTSATIAATGGAISHLGTRLEVRDSVFVGGSANLGGGIYAGGETLIIDSIFNANFAVAAAGGANIGGVAGAFLNVTLAPVELDGCTITQNQADDGAGVGGSNGTTTVLRNCIVWNNVDATGTTLPAQLKGPGAHDVAYCLVQSLLTPVPGEPPPNPANFPGSLDTDPRFIDPLGPDSTPGTADDDLRLSATSPCIDAGDNASIPAGVTADFIGNPRRRDEPSVADTGLGAAPLVDMGAYEFTSDATASLVIDSGAAATGSTAVTLFLALSPGSGVTRMRFSDDSVIWGAWQLFAATSPWTLPAADGVRTVYGQFTDGSGAILASASDSITLDATPPTGTVVIDSGAATTATLAVVLTLNATDATAVTDMSFSNDGVAWSAWEPFAATRGWTLVPGDGLKTVFARYRDSFGHVSAPASDTITLLFDPCAADTVAPTITCPVAIPVAFAGAGCQAAVPDLRLDATASDNCTAAAAIVISQSPAPGTLLPAGVHTITLTATDGSGNRASCPADWTVEDRAFLRGNIDNVTRSAHSLDILDLVALINVLFKGTTLPFDCQAALDVNNDGTQNIVDVIALAQGMFRPAVYTIPDPAGAPGVVTVDGGSIPSVLGCNSGENCP